ncbi:uncharacterized protein LOC117892088 [Drosophila subobscura]|uniref:uncharacterized protein LOC117892088 n=1 Tax=Drosophila subobscura TaxID=7241 RepID=UPI00155B0692|nr:uncharacterized protein LOC117892088 [Drosophila subobscura]
MRLKVFMVFATILLIPSARGVINEAMEVIEMIRVVTSAILKTWDVVESLPANGIHDKQQQLMNRIEEVDDHIRSLEQMESLRAALTIETLIREFHQQSALLHKLNVVKDLTTIVKTRYTQLSDYVQHKDALEAGTLLKFAEWNVDPGTSSLAFQLDLLHVSLFGDEEQADNNSDSSNTLLSQLTINYEESPDQMCVAKHSAQQFAFQLFTKAALTELKAYSIMEFSWMTQRDLGQGNFTQEIALMRQNYQRRMNASVRVLSQVMAGSGRVYWRCDPGKKKHVSGETYDRVTRLLQGYVENEANLGEDQSCWGTCGDYQETRSMAATRAMSSSAASCRSATENSTTAAAWTRSFRSARPGGTPRDATITFSPMARFSAGRAPAESARRPLKRLFLVSLSLLALLKLLLPVRRAGTAL